MVFKPRTGLPYLELPHGLAEGPVQLLGGDADVGEVDEVAVHVLGAHGADGVGALLLVVELAGAAVQQDGVEHSQHGLLHLPALHRHLQHLRAAVHGGGGSGGGTTEGPVGKEGCWGRVVGAPAWATVLGHSPSAKPLYSP